MNNANGPHGSVPPIPPPMAGKLNVDADQHELPDGTVIVNRLVQRLVLLPDGSLQKFVVHETIPAHTHGPPLDGPRDAFRCQCGALVSRSKWTWICSCGTEVCQRCRHYFEIEGVVLTVCPACAETIEPKGFWEWLKWLLGL